MDEVHALGYADISKNLESLLAQISDRPHSDARIELCAARVVVDGRPVHLTNRELEICFAIAAHNRPVPGETLAALMFPAQDYAASLNCIKVYVHRVRDKIAADFIVCERNGYRFRSDVRIDLEEFEGVVQLLERQPFLTKPDLDTLHAALAGLCALRNAPVWRWDWFESTQAKIEKIVARAAATLAAEAFARNATAELLDLSRLILNNNPCDEQAREIAIKAHLAAGNPADAICEFRQYEAHLARDLQATPSPHIRKLLQIA